MQTELSKRLRRVRDAIEEIGQRSQFLASRLEAIRALLDTIASVGLDLVAAGTIDESVLESELDTLADILAAASRQLRWGGYPQTKDLIGDAETRIRQLLESLGLSGLGDV